MQYNYPIQLSIVRFLLKAESFRKNPIPFHTKYFNEFGDTFSIRIGKTKHVLLSRDNEVAEYILQKNQKNSSVEVFCLKKKALAALPMDFGKKIQFAQVDYKEISKSNPNKGNHFNFRSENVHKFPNENH